MKNPGSVLQKLNDDQLMTAAKKGGSDELGFLFEKYKKPLFNFFLKLTSNQNAAEDLIQDTFLKIMNYRHNYREGSNFRAWIYTIAYNLYKDYLKKHRVTMNIEEVSEILIAQGSTDKSVLLREEIKLLRRSIDKLAENKKRVLILSRFQDLKYEEIGQIMEMSESAVKVTIFRALKELKANYLHLAGEAS